MWMSPAVIRMRLQTAEISVVLPAPLGPSSPKKVPSGIVEVEIAEGQEAVVVALGQAAARGRASGIRR